MDISTALGDFVPMEGDVIRSQWGQATYTNGRWRGAVSQFYPGFGYKYFSNRNTKKKDEIPDEGRVIPLNTGGFNITI
jgi:hypothetical protein